MFGSGDFLSAGIVTLDVQYLSMRENERGLPPATSKQRLLSFKLNILLNMVKEYDRAHNISIVGTHGLV